MSKSAIQRLDVDATVRKRAEWDAFEFTLPGNGRVRDGPDGEGLPCFDCYDPEGSA